MFVCAVILMWFGVQKKGGWGVAIRSIDCDPLNDFIENNVLVDL
jgi:hypothetical protein